MRLNQIALPAADLAASIAFYKALGLRLIVLTEDYARFELPEGESTLSLVRRAAPLPPDSEGVHVYFECSDLDGRVSELKALELAFESGPEDKRWLWREAWL